MASKRCTKCGELKPLEQFYKAHWLSDGRRPDCIECHKKQLKEYTEKNRTDVTIRQMARDIFKRIGQGSYRHVECRIGDSWQEVASYIEANFKADIERLIASDESPSIDRIDSSKHYEIGNLRIIPRIVNSRLGQANSLLVLRKPIKAIFPSGEERHYKSVSEAASELNIKRDTIYNCIRENRPIKLSHNGLGNPALIGVRFEREQ